MEEISAIEGFDDDTAEEIQTRAQEYLERLEAARDARRKELGVEDEVREIEGVTTEMMVTFGENEIKTVEDLAGCATDELTGWFERSKGESTRHPGILDGFDVSRDEAERMIMLARLSAGWIDSLPEDEPEDEEAEDADSESEAGAEASETASPATTA